MSGNEWLPMQVLLIVILLICLIMLKFAPPKNDPYLPMQLPNYEFERMNYVPAP